MRRHLGTGLTTFTYAALLFACSGCGGAGNETSSTPPTPKAIASADQAPSSEVPKVITEPARKVDPKKVVDVVKGDIEGGEAESGGTPESFLYQEPDTKFIKDEPFTAEIPRGLMPVAAFSPQSNPLTKGKIELGKQLYFDPRVSLNGTVSCATCHNPNKGWTDNLKTSVGIDGQVGGRNAPTVLNTVYGKTMFWDGRAPSLEGQCQGPPQNPIEMGKQSYKQIVERLRAISGYREQFQLVFGTEVTLDGFAKAIAAFERVAALSGNSAYDKYNSGEPSALTESQKRGMVLFGLRQSEDDEYKTGVVLKKAQCTSCHAGFNFTDEQFHNLGIGWKQDESKFADIGRFAIEAVGSKNLASKGAFKTPTVRDVARTAPYMHDGSIKTLEEVVEHYDKGGNANPALDKDMNKLNLTAPEKADLIAFMQALNGEIPKLVLPTLPAGSDGKVPNPAAALETPSAKTALSDVIHHSIAVR